MSIKIQKILRFIPIVNFTTMFCWLVTYSKVSRKPKQLFKMIFKLFAVMLLLSIPQIIVQYVFDSDWLNRIVYWVTTIIVFYIISCIAIKDQEQLLAEYQNNKK